MTTKTLSFKEIEDGVKSDIKEYYGKRTWRTLAQTGGRIFFVKGHFADVVVGEGDSDFISEGIRLKGFKGKDVKEILCRGLYESSPQRDLHEHPGYRIEGVDMDIRIKNGRGNPRQNGHHISTDIARDMTAKNKPKHG